MKFDRNMSGKEFLSFYNYRSDLQKICREMNLPTSGTKADLNERIVAFLDGKPIQNSVRTTNKTISTPLTLMTRVIDGVKLNADLREFMEKHFQIEKIKFNKSMAVAIRKAKAENDGSIDVQYLCDIYQGTVMIDTSKDDKSYQWNQFLKDFCTDPNNAEIKDKLSVAAEQWQTVKLQSGSKKYRTQ